MDDHADEITWLQHTLTADIPLGGAMALIVSRLDQTGIELSLPLPPSVNDKGTAFGGALASAMILAGWSLPRLLLRRAGVDAQLVIGRCEVRFLAPVDGAFRAACAWPDPAVRHEFMQRLARRGRASLMLEPVLLVEDKVAATLSAKYAALMSHPEGGNDA